MATSELSTDAVVAFGRELRERGLSVGTDRIVTFARAVAALAPLERDDLYWAGRASLIARPEDVEAFDAAFGSFFRSGVTVEVNLPAPAADRTERVEGEEDGSDGGETAGESAVAPTSAEAGEPAETEAALRMVASAVEVLRDKSFADLSAEERARIERVIRRLEVEVPTRTTRRLRPARAGTVDLRRTLRRSLRTHGEPFHRAWRSRGRRARPLVLVLDVSGSMTPYARALMQFGFAAIAAGRRVEVFCFGTRLTRVTKTLMSKDPGRALHEVGRFVEDWEGGTRIGSSLKELVDGWGQRAALRGSVVVICSDGLERGDPEVLRAQMRRLRRLAHRVVWVNPLKGGTRYEPVARGMAAALPSVDVFLPGHNLESLEALGRVLGD